jgi:lipid-A-disaccharide synthase
VKSLYVIAGEASGDILGGKLMTSLYQKLDGNVQFFGVGGPYMQEAGLESFFPMNDLSVMGLMEVLPKLPLLMRRLKEVEGDIRLKRPDALVTIDAPGFNFRVAKKLASSPFPIIHYVAPSVWAYHKDRAKKCAAFLDHLLTLLPFEPPYFTEHQLETTFVGHSILESGADVADGALFRQKHKIGQDVPLLCILPGSRAMEINKLTPVFAKSFEKLQRFFPGIKAVIPTLPSLLPQLKQLFRRHLGILYENLIFCKRHRPKI